MLRTIVGFHQDGAGVREPPDPEESAAVARRLAEAGCVAPDEEAAELASAAPDRPTLDAWVGRRTRGEPLAWITGRTRFGGRPLRVDPGVFVPRAQSEELARRAAARLADPGTAVSTRGRRAPVAPRAADLCTGAGAVARHLAAEVPGARVVGVDVDPRAAACARRNGVACILGDVGDALNAGAFDVVTAVAPYVPTGELRLLPPDVVRHEPRMALDGGPDGLDLVRRIVLSARHLLRPGGWLLVEVGGCQDDLLAPSLAAAGFGPPLTWSDDDGDLRGLAARLDGTAEPR